MRRNLSNIRKKFNSFLYKILTPKFRPTLKVQEIISHIVKNYNLPIYVVGDTFLGEIPIAKEYFMSFCGNFSAYLLHESINKSCLILWPHKNENRFLSVLAHEMGHFLEEKAKSNNNLVDLTLIRPFPLLYSPVVKEQNAWFYGMEFIGMFIPKTNKVFWNIFYKIYLKSIKTYLRGVHIK